MRGAAIACGAIAASIGLLVLLGWAADIPLLKSVRHTWTAMQPVTAVGLILSGGVLMLQHRLYHFQAALLIAVTVVTGAAVVEHLTAVSIPYADTLLFPRDVVAQPLSFPGRMADVSTAEFGLFIMAVVLARFPRALSIAKALTAIGLFVAVVGGTGYLFGAQRMVRMGAHTTMAVHTALAFAALFLGCLLAFPPGRWMHALMTPKTGGKVARHMVGMVVVFPLLVSLAVEAAGQWLDVQPAYRMAVALLAISTGLLLFVIWIAIKLNESDEKADIADQAVRRAEARLRSVVETAVDAMVVIDDHGTILSFNKAAEHIFGYTEKEAMGHDVHMLMPEPDRSRHADYLDAYKRTGVPKIIGRGREVVGMRKDGTLVDIDLSIAEWWDNGQRFFTGIMRDVTARKRTEEALAASETRYRAIFEQAAVGIALLQMDGQIIEVNQRLCHLLGYGRRELLKMTFDEITEPIDLVAEHRLIQDMLSGARGSYSIEKRYVCKSGDLIWVRVTSSLEQAASQPPRRRISIVEDLQQQKQTTAALHDTAARLEFALKGANAGMWEWNMADDTHVWTDEMFELIGLKRDAKPSYDTFLSAVLPDDREVIGENLQAVLARHDPRFRLSFRIRHPAKGIRWLSSNGRISYGDDGAPLRMGGISIDITDLKRAEEEAERANRSKSRFLAAASHDLRQPVQALVLFTSALASRLQGHPAAKVVHSMDVSLGALQNLLEELLDVSRLDAGVIVPKIETIPLHDIVQRLAAEYTMRARERGLELRVVPCTNRVITDPTLLERIVRNLLENAIRYTDTGRILVGCRRRSGDRIVLQVIDSGIGIPADQREAIFQEFYQVGNPARDQSKGLGLGLSIVRRLAHLLGHRIGIASIPGRGTCFSIELEAEPPVVPRVPARAEPAPVAGAKRPGLVMVVDDEAMIRLGLSVLFEDWGWEVECAADGEEALAWIESHGRCPEVIIADYRLQHGRVGTDVVRDIQAACGRSIPAVIVTGDTAPDRIAEINRSGFEIAHKPVVPSHLQRLVMDVIGGQALDA